MSGYIINPFSHGGGGPGLPAGAIIGVTSGVPTGFTAYDSLTGRLININNTTAGASGGSNSVRNQGSNTGSSAHKPDDTHVYVRQPGGTAGAAACASTTQGSHAHTAYFVHRPKRAGVKLVKCSSDGTPVPVNGLLFGDTAALADDDVGYTTLNDQAAWLGHDTTTVVTGASSSVSFSSASFSHTHHVLGCQDNAVIVGDSTTDYNGNYPSSGPSHGHGQSSFSLSAQVKSKVLKAFRRTIESGIIGDRTIVLFDGATVPDGWFLCNGSNGTIDLNSYFIRLQTTSLGAVYQSASQTTGSVTLTSGGSHNHAIPVNGAGWWSYYSHNGNHSHTHGASYGWTGMTPVYRTLKAIQYIA